MYEIILLVTPDRLLVTTHGRAGLEHQFLSYEIRENTDLLLREQICLDMLLEIITQSTTKLHAINAISRTCKEINNALRPTKIQLILFKIVRAPACSAPILHIP